MENGTMECFKLFRDVCRSVNSTLNLKEVLELITKGIGCQGLRGVSAGQGAQNIKRQRVSRSE